ncbi:MAG: DNA replication/repair protein RecF [Pseudomonadota bacterium]|nr:DNA replication/repair protein RecF [Pseudomonadota bacterium]
MKPLSKICTKPLNSIRSTATSITRLVLTNFRSYTALSLKVDATIIVLTGQNGAGKTNLLEAISFLVPGRGIRRARLADVGHRKPGEEFSNQIHPWAIAATIENSHGSVEIGTGLQPVIKEGITSNSTNRTVKIDGVPAKGQIELGERLSALWLTPDMERLFLEGASGRRRFLDRLVFGYDPAHANRLRTYEKAMRERSILLAQGSQFGSTDTSWVSVLEKTMVEKGVAIVAARRTLLERLNSTISMGTGLFPSAYLQVICELDGWLGAMSAIEVEEKFSHRLLQNRRQDPNARSPRVGPHRSDLLVSHLDKNLPADQCSTGEQKSLLISIVLANTRLQGLERGIRPILLLDEITAHLDMERREALFAEIKELGVQTWMTGSDTNLFAPWGDVVQHFAISIKKVSESKLTPLIT